MLQLTSVGLKQAERRSQAFIVDLCNTKLLEEHIEQRQCDQGISEAAWQA